MMEIPVFTKLQAGRQPKAVKPAPAEPAYTPPYFRTYQRPLAMRLALERAREAQPPMRTLNSRINPEVHDGE